MRHFELVHIGRHPTEHYASYNVISNGHILVEGCTYDEGYLELVKLMQKGDTFQEIEGESKSNIFTYTDALQGYFMTNPEDGLSLVPKSEEIPNRTGFDDHSARKLPQRSILLLFVLILGGILLIYVLTLFL